MSASPLAPQSSPLSAVPLLDIKRQYDPLRAELLAAITQSVRFRPLCAGARLRRIRARRGRLHRRSPCHRLRLGQRRIAVGADGT